MTASEILLRSPGLDERARKTVNRIASAAGKAVRLISDLLDFTQSRHGAGIPVHPVRADLGRLIASVVEEFRIVHFQRTFDLDLRPDLVGEYDSDRIAQALTNLVRNALQHGAPQSVIRIEAQGAEDVLELRVHNEGPPIDEATMSQLFEPMKRGRRAAAAGLGLGLYIVEQIARGHRGHVDVRSTASQGTTFTLAWPRKAHTGRNGSRPGASTFGEKHDADV